MNVRHTSIGLVFAALGGLALGACFTGQDARGLPCTADVHCGLGQECIDGYCEGVFACPEGTEIPAEAVCDGMFDCENGNDEHPDLCETDAFFCDDGESTIPLEQVCDGTAQCQDLSDEASALCILDECIDPAEAYAFSEVMPLTGYDHALGVFVGNFVDDSPSEFIVAPLQGSSLKLVEFGTMGPEESELPGDLPVSNGPEFIGSIVDVMPVDFDGNGIDDLIVRTDENRLYGYGGVESGTPTQLFFHDDMGTSQPYFQVPFEIVDLAAGKLNEDSFLDLVVLTENGAILTAEGNPQALISDVPPFTLSLADAALVPDAVGIELVDIDEMNVDELLVVRAAGPDASLRVGRVETDPTPANFWQFLEVESPLPFVPDELVAGRIDNVGGLDLAILRIGEVAVLTQVQPAVFGMPSIVTLGAPGSGLVLSDFNCDDTPDIVVNVENPPSVRVLFVSNAGVLDMARTLDIESEGTPRGRVGVMRLDADASWDVFHAIEGATAADSLIRGFLSGDSVGP